MLRLLIFCVLTAFAMPASAQQFSAADYLGKPNFSLACPTGSVWSLEDGGVCKGCPGGKKPTLGKCPRTVPGSFKTAIFSHNLKQEWHLCRLGTFRKPKSRQCWTCPEHHIRVPGVKFNEPGICTRPPFIAMDDPGTVKKMPLKALLDPLDLFNRSKTLGCEGYGKGAFISGEQLGSCWRCPAKTPVRTLLPPTLPKACVSGACGGNGQRGCFIWERSKACDTGLAHNPFKGQCLPRKNLVCKPLVGALAKARLAMIEINQATTRIEGEAIDKIPGLKELMAVMDGITDKVEDQAMQLLDKLPTELLEEQMDDLFKNPEQVAAITAVMTAMGEHQDELVALILNPDTACDPSMAALTNKMVEIINRASPGRRADAGNRPEFATVFGELFASPAHAATGPRITNTLLHGIGVSSAIALTTYVKKGGVQLPVSFSIEMAWQIFPDGTVRPTFFFVGGFDFPGKSEAFEFADVSVVGSVMLPQQKNCPAIAAQMEFFELLGVSLNCGGISAINFKLDSGRYKKVGEFFTREGVASALSGGPRAPISGGSTWVPDDTSDTKVKKFSIGGNGALAVMPPGGWGDGARAAMAQ